MGQKERKDEKTAPDFSGAVFLYIVVLDGFFLGVWILILIFPRDGRLPIRFFLPDSLGVGLAVFRHGFGSYRLVLGASSLLVTCCGRLIWNRVSHNPIFPAAF